jgi:hypothetical protein
VVGFNGDGGAYSPFGGYPGISHMPVRMVRNGPPPGPSTLATGVAEARTTADQRWVTRGGEALDKTTDLIWERCSVGRTWSADLGCQGIVHEYTFDEALSLQGGGRRVPTEHEINTLFYHGRVKSGMPLVGAGIFGAVTPLVIADLMRGTGRYNVAQGAVATVQGVGAALSGLAAGVLVDHSGYSAAFLSAGGAAAAAFGTFLLVMPETAAFCRRNSTIIRTRQRVVPSQSQPQETA